MSAPDFLKAIRRRNQMVALFPWLSRLGELKQLLAASSRWRHEGWFAPVPHFVRRAALLSEARAMGAEIFIETGTYKGGTIWSMLGEFRCLVTIEVVPALAALARQRFARFHHVTVLEGDSAEVLPSICSDLDASCLFYLDGHYSGGVTGKGTEECPVIRELDAIFTFTKVPFRIVIDDARLFGIDPAYPAIDAVAGFVHSRRPEMSVRIENDAILIHDAEPGSQC
jgi:hypothetical protein